MNKVAIQGLPGCYTEMALQAIEPEVERASILYLETFDEVFNAVQLGEAARAVVAFSNTRIDSIQRPSELLMSHGAMGRFWVDGGVTIPVHHCLSGNRGADLSSIDTVISQPEALRQCGDVLRELNGKITIQETRDTALSAQKVSESGSLRSAAICSTAAAELYGLEVLRHDVQDDDINLTRFVRFTTRENATLHDDTDNSIAILTLPQRVGSLDDSLSTFTSHNIDLRTIRSRNIPNTDMQVDMIVELRKGMDKGMREVVRDLARIGVSVTFIGTYKDMSPQLTTELGEQDKSVISVESELVRFDQLIGQLRKG